MVTPQQSTVADRYHVVCDDHAFWQWSGATDKAGAHKQAEQLAADPHAGCARIWILPCDGAPCATCAAFSTGSEHADDVFPAVVAQHEPYWRRG